MTTPTLAKGFRPFFLLAAAFAVAMLPLWLLVLGGRLAPATYFDPTIWHAHEMLFGFVVAVIAGFLLTAVASWTKRETLVGGSLFALATIWLAGRCAIAFAGRLPRGVPAAVDLAFLPLLAIAIGRPLVLAKNYRNLVMLLLLTALFATNLVVHLDALGVFTRGAAHRACVVAVDLVVLLILIIVGRVLPMFTRNATDVARIRSVPALEVLTVACMVLLTAADVATPNGQPTAVLAGVVGLLAAARAVFWGSRHTAKHPLLWILHAGYAWLALGLVLRGLAGFGAWVPSSLATHALTVGAIGSLTLGMMVRVTLGHTGRALVGSRGTAWAFGAILTAATIRVVGPWLAPAWMMATWVTSGVLWTAAFLFFLVAYSPALVRARVDGEPG